MYDLSSVFNLSIVLVYPFLYLPLNLALSLPSDSLSVSLPPHPLPPSLSPLSLPPVSLSLPLSHLLTSPSPSPQVQHVAVKYSLEAAPLSAQTSSISTLFGLSFI
jgi:hypothetical protein